MKIDFNFLLKDLEGNGIPEANAGKLLANVLVQQTKGDALKFSDWALSLHKGLILDLDTSDQETLKALIKETEAFTVLAKAQLLQVMRKVDE